MEKTTSYKFTNKEVKLLKNFLSLDLDEIGYSEKEQKVLNDVYDKLSNKKTKKQKTKSLAVPIIVNKIIPIQGIIASDLKH